MLMNRATSPRSTSEPMSNDMNFRWSNSLAKASLNVMIMLGPIEPRHPEVNPIVGDYNTNRQSKLTDEEEA